MNTIPLATANAATTGRGGNAGPAVPLARGEAKDLASLKDSARQMEAMFVQQLFQAMRAGIPEDGILERNEGEDLFTSMLDQRVAEQVAAADAGPSDLSASIFESLRLRLHAAADTPR